MTDCPHPATLTVTGLPGIRECTGCGVYLTERPDGTLERA